jgi:3D (Asp-Asp-Asp) domain-containing protein
VKNKILASILTLSILTNGLGYIYFDNKLNDNKQTVIKLQDDKRTKSAEIAKLDAVIIKKDKNLATKEDGIFAKNSQLESLSGKVEYLRDNAKNLRSQKQELKEQIRKFKAENDRLKTSFNNKKERSGAVVAVAETDARLDNQDKSINNVKHTQQIQRVRHVQKQRSQNNGINVEMTAYVAMCTEGCTGITATGVNIKNITSYHGHRIIATDPNVIPLNSVVRVEINGKSFTAISLDTGGAINGRIVDFLVGSTSEANSFGRQKATITIID